MARDINDTSFNESYTGGTATFDRHHGGRLFHSRKEKRMKEIARKKVEEVKPDVVVLQAGGNDLQSLSRQGKPVLTPIHIAQEIIGTGKLCAKFGATVAISAILPRVGYHQHVWEANIFLRGLCAVNDFTFIDHSGIVENTHLLKDGVHLNSAGTKMFADNILSCLNILSC